MPRDSGLAVVRGVFDSQRDGNNTSTAGLVNLPWLIISIKLLYGNYYYYGCSGRAGHVLVF
jgi:hypothetical protein